MSLANISVNNQSPGLLRGSWLKRRPDSDNDDGDKGSLEKVPRHSWYVTLESESPQPTDEDDESVYSIQGKETDYVADTSDTSTHTWVSSSDGGDLSLHVEYEVASLSEGPNPFDNEASSSDVSDIVAMGILTFCDSDPGLADDSNDSRSSVDSEIGKADYWTCIQCNAKNNNPMFRYCEKCYQIRKNFFPPRPKWRKSRREIEPRKDSSRILLDSTSQVENQKELPFADSGLGSSQDSKCSLPLDLNLDTVSTSSTGVLSSPASPSLSMSSKEFKYAVDSEFAAILPTFPTNAAIAVGIRDTQSEPEYTIDSTLSTIKGDNIESKSMTFSSGGWLSTGNKSPKYRDEKIDIIDGTQGESDSKLCITCTAAPKNGAFVHGAVTHICCCYRCAVKVWSKTKRCPICNRKVTNVLKAFYT